jgi:hypothetical protein
MNKDYIEGLKRAIELISALNYESSLGVNLARNVIAKEINALEAKEEKEDLDRTLHEIYKTKSGTNIQFYELKERHRRGISAQAEWIMDT